MVERTTNRYGGNTMLILGLIVAVLVIAGYLLMQNEPEVTGTANPIPPTSGQSDAPSGTQPQPQGHPGPTTTEGTGSPPSSPQGEAPPNMQAKPSGAQ